MLLQAALTWTMWEVLTGHSDVPLLQLSSHPVTKGPRPYSRRSQKVLEEPQFQISEQLHSADKKTEAQSFRTAHLGLHGRAGAVLCMTKNNF